MRVGGTTLRARRLAICAGPWTNDVLALLGRQLNLTVTREQVLYLEPEDPEAFAPDRFPIWIWMGEPCYYGFPVFGEPAVKVAQDGGGEETTADGRSFEPDEANRARVLEFMRRTFPRAVGREHLVKTCLYTLPPDRDFVRIAGDQRACDRVAAIVIGRYRHRIARLQAARIEGVVMGLGLRLGGLCDSKRV